MSVLACKITKKEAEFSPASL